MNSFVVVFLAALACANAGILQGPSSRTTLVGPDGSTISAVAPGGSILTAEQPGLIAHSAPALLAPSVWASPSVVAAPGLIARSAWLGAGANTIVAGPSGTIATSEPWAARGLVAPITTAALW